MERIRISGGLSKVNRLWRETIGAFKVAYSTEEAFRIITRLDRGLTDVLMKETAEINLKALPDTREWLITVTSGIKGQSLMRSYESMFGFLAKGIASGQVRIDTVLTEQLPLAEIWEALSPAVQSELRSQGRSPEFVLKSDPAL